MEEVDVESLFSSESPSHSLFWGAEDHSHIPIARIARFLEMGVDYV